jgi:HNH endonuclease
VTPAERLPCIHGCERFFGGDETLRRHRVEGRCLSDRELKVRNIRKDVNGVWRRSVDRKASPFVDRRTGQDYMRRKEARWLEKNGYVRVRMLDGSTAMEHRVQMESMLGRPLHRGESVHHKNGVRHDNRPENLELWVGGIRYGQRATDLTCPNCGSSYAVALGLVSASERFQTAVPADLGTDHATDDSGAPAAAGGLG